VFGKKNEPIKVKVGWMEKEEMECKARPPRGTRSNNERLSIGRELGHLQMALYEDEMIIGPMHPNITFLH
jgi:hypothetical protein